MCSETHTPHPKPVHHHHLEYKPHTRPDGGFPPITESLSLSLCQVVLLVCRSMVFTPRLWENAFGKTNRRSVLSPTAAGFLSHNESLSSAAIHMRRPLWRERAFLLRRHNRALTYEFKCQTRAQNPSLTQHDSVL